MTRRLQHGKMDLYFKVLALFIVPRLCVTMISASPLNRYRLKLFMDASIDDALLFCLSRANRRETIVNKICLLSEGSVLLFHKDISNGHSKVQLFP